MHQPRVLVVDDEPAVRALLMRALGEAAYEMVAVPVDRAGMEAAGASGVPYQLVITNSHTPSMTGEQLLDHLRCLFAGLPILHLDDVRPFGIDALLRAVALAVPEQAALKPSAAPSYPYLPARMWTTPLRLAELVARYRGLTVEGVELSEQDFMFRSGGPLEVH